MIPAVLLLAGALAASFGLPFLLRRYRRLPEARRRRVRLVLLLSAAVLLLFAFRQPLLALLPLAAAAVSRLIYAVGPALRLRQFLRNASGGKAPPPASMSREEAAEMLDVPLGASPEEIRAAYLAFMKKHHPDKGGSAYLAKKAGEAKDALLRKEGGEA